MKKNILIIGGGPGGYVAAIRAAHLDFEVTLIEEDKLGGTCLNRGCISTKALYKNANVIDTLKKSADFGINFENSSFSIDMEKVQDRKNGISKNLRDGIEQLFKSLGINLIKGHANFIDKNHVQYTSADGVSEIIEADNIIIATGSKTAKLPIDGADLPNVITSDEALELTNIPDKIAIIGGGVIGVEFAGIFSAFGKEVTIIEFAPRILPMFDEEMVKRLAIFLKKRGIKINAGTAVKKIEKDDSSLKIVAEAKGKEVEYNADLVLIAAGRNINIDGLNLDALGIEYDRKGIKVDEKFKTSVDNIYAIGDVIGGQMLAHVASEEGIACVEGISGNDTSVNYNCIPSCVFSFPELSSVGSSEDELKKNGIDYSVGKFNFGANSKAQTIGEVEGQIKVLVDSSNKKILGVHILGPEASDLIHEAALAVQNGLTTNDIKHTIHAHPSLSEAFHEAVLASQNEAIHAVHKK